MVYVYTSQLFKNDIDIGSTTSKCILYNYRSRWTIDGS